MDGFADFARSFPNGVFTFFGLLSREKAFHLWTIMFTYLGLVGAWFYYRNHGEEENENVNLASEIVPVKINKDSDPTECIEESTINLQCEDKQLLSVPEVDSRCEQIDDENTKILPLLTAFEEGTDLSENHEKTGLQLEAIGEEFKVSEVVFSSENSSLFDGEFLCGKRDQSINGNDNNESLKEGQTFQDHGDCSGVNDDHISLNKTSDITESVIETPSKQTNYNHFAIENNPENPPVTIVDGHVDLASRKVENPKIIVKDVGQLNDLLCEHIITDVSSGEKSVFVENNPNMDENSVMNKNIDFSPRREKIVESALDNYFEHFTEYFEISEEPDGFEVIEDDKETDIAQNLKHTIDDLSIDSENATVKMHHLEDGEGIENNTDLPQEDKIQIVNLSDTCENPLLCEFLENCEENSDYSDCFINHEFFNEIGVDKEVGFESENELPGEKNSLVVSHDSPISAKKEICPDIEEDIVLLDSETLLTYPEDILLKDLAVDVNAGLEPKCDTFAEDIGSQIEDSKALTGKLSSTDNSTSEYTKESKTDFTDERKPLSTTRAKSKGIDTQWSNLSGVFGKRDFDEKVFLEIIPAEYLIVNSNIQHGCILSEETSCSRVTLINNDNNENIYRDGELVFGRCGINLVLQEATINRREAHLGYFDLTQNYIDFNLLRDLHPKLQVNLLRNESLSLLCSRNYLRKHAQFAREGIMHRSNLQSALPARNLHVTCGSFHILNTYERATRINANSVRQSRSGSPISGRFGNFCFDSSSFQSADEASPGKSEIVCCKPDKKLNSHVGHLRGPHSSTSALEFEEHIVPDGSNCEKTRDNQQGKLPSFAYDYIFSTSLAAVDSESFSEPSSSWESSEDFIEADIGGFFDTNLSKSDKYIPNTTDVCHPQNLRRLKRLSTSDIEENCFPKRVCDVLDIRPTRKRKHVSESFDIPFERKYEFADNEYFSKHFDFGEELSDSSSSVDSVAHKNESLLAENSDEFVNKVVVKELFIGPEHKQDSKRKVDLDLKMGQATSSVLGQKGTLAMPVNDSYLRGIYIKNQGEYAIINRKHTRFSPLISEISVDRRLRITLELPSYQLKANEVKDVSSKQEQFTKSLEILNRNRSNPTSHEKIVARELNCNQKSEARPQEFSERISKNKRNDGSSGLEKNKDTEIINEVLPEFNASIDVEPECETLDDNSDERHAEINDSRSLLKLADESVQETVDSISKAVASINLRHAAPNNKELIKSESEFHSNPNQEDFADKSTQSVIEENFAEQKPEISIESVEVDSRPENAANDEEISAGTREAKSQRDVLRSKSLSSLPKTKPDPMAWFYRNQSASVYFDDTDTNIIDFGKLRKAKSAEFARKKPKIILSANFERKPVKETNLDQLMKSLENIRPLSEQNSRVNKIEDTKELLKMEKDVVEESNESEDRSGQINEMRVVDKQSKQHITEKDYKPILRIVKKAKSTTGLNQRGSFGSKKEPASVAKLIERFDTSSPKSEMVADINNVNKQKSDLQRPKSCNFSSAQEKNARYVILERQTVPGKDINNNQTNLNSHDVRYTIDPKGKAAWKDDSPAKLHSFMTNSRDSIPRDLRSENISETKTGLKAQNKVELMKSKKTIEAKQKELRIEDQLKNESKIDQINEKIELSNAQNKDSVVMRKRKPNDVDKDEKRDSIYGLTVVLSEAPNDGEVETVIDGIKAKSTDEFWLRNNADNSGIENDQSLQENNKVMDIDVILNSTEYNDSVEIFCLSCDEMLEDGSKCSKCIDAVDAEMPDGFSTATPNGRARSSFRREKRLRKWLEEKQSSISIDENPSVDGRASHHQSKRLKQIAIAEGINVKGLQDQNIERAILNKLESENKFTDFIAQLRYLITLEDDGAEKPESGKKKNESPIKILKEYEISRQLRKGTSPFTSDDEGNASDAFTDITDASLSDYSRSRTSLNSLSFSRGSLHKSFSISTEHSVDLEEQVDGQSRKSLDKIVAEENDLVAKEADDYEAAMSDVFPGDDVSGLMSQAALAVRKRRGRSRRGLQQTPSYHASEAITTADSREPDEVKTTVSHEITAKNNDFFYKNNIELYADSPCSLSTERIGEKLYNNLRLKLVDRTQKEINSPISPSLAWQKSPPQKSPRQSASSMSTRSLSNSTFGSVDLESLPSPVIKELRASPQQQKRSLQNLQQHSPVNSEVSASEHALHIAHKSPVYRRDSPFRKSTGSYNRAKEEHRSMPNLVSKQHRQEQSPEMPINHQPRFPSVNLLMNNTRHSSLRSPLRSPVNSPVRSPLRSPVRSPLRSPIRSPHLSELEEDNQDYLDCDTNYSDFTGFFSDSSLDTGAVFEGFDGNDDDVFRANSPRRRQFSSDFDDFAAQNSGGSSDEFFVPLNTSTEIARMHGREISCAFPPCKSRDYMGRSQKTNFTSCVACFTYYCSKQCLKAHWKEHKQTCYYGRVNYYTKALIRRFETSSIVNEKLSEIALKGFQNGGRGCVLVTFSSPMAAKFFLVSGTDSFIATPVFAPMNEISNGRITTKHHVLLLQTMQDYVPDYEFVVDVTVYIGKQNEVRATSQSRMKSTALLRCTKVPINAKFLSTDFQQPSDSSYDIKVFYLPRSQQHHFVNDTEARRHYCREVSYGLRRYGIQLKADFPDVYDKLCLYVEEDIEFAPITLYGQANGRNYKCVVFPEGFNGHSGTVELQGRGMIV